jgi:hypothetical protein
MRLGLKLAAPLLLVAALFGGYCAGRHVASKEGRDAWLAAEANRLTVEVQIAAMLRAGDYESAIKRSDVYIAADLVGFDAFAQPDQPPLGGNVLSALKLASVYQSKYRSEFDQSQPRGGCCQDRILHALSVGAANGELRNQAFANKYLGAGTPAQSTAQPLTQPKGQ